MTFLNFLNITIIIINSPVSKLLDTLNYILSTIIFSRTVHYINNIIVITFTYNRVVVVGTGTSSLLNNNNISIKLLKTNQSDHLKYIILLHYLIKYL